MKARVIFEEPILVASYTDYNSSGIPCKVSINMLKNAEIGTVWRAEKNSCCGRDVFESSFELIYRNSTGCAVLEHIYTTSNEPNPQPESAVELIWVEFLEST